ncbi:hypothetical protein V1478_010950, partial [Vespula squamosa]
MNADAYDERLDGSSSGSFEREGREGNQPVTTDKLLSKVARDADNELPLVKASRFHCIYTLCDEKTEPSTGSSSSTMEKVFLPYVFS